MADAELDELERRLKRGVLVRRLIIGMGAIAMGLVLLFLSVVLVVQHRGELFRFSLASGGLTLAVVLLASWPLGVYRRLGTLTSPCRAVLTSKELASLGGAPFEIESVHDIASMCSLDGVEPGGTRRILGVEIDRPSSGYTIEDKLRFFRAEKKERLVGIGDEAWLLERPGERRIVIKRRGSVLYVKLSSSTYDDAVTRRIIDHVKSKLALLDR